MKAMKRTIKLLTLFCAFTTAFYGNAQVQEDLSASQSVVTNIVDTIVRTDTILIKEVIERTDIVHRTETVVRYEEKVLGGSYQQVSLSSDTVVTPAKSILSESIMQAGNDVAQTNIPGGKYIWVPDSLNTKVNDLLSGQKLYSWEESKKTEDEFDPNEMVTFRGDTIPMVLRDRNLGRYDRGLFNFLYIPKGIWQIGITASYGEFSTENLEVLDLISDIDFKGHIFAIRPYFSYFLKNNISVGMRLGYTSGKANIGSFNVDIDEDMSFKLHDIMYKSESYTAALTFSQYLGIARRGRFGVFNEVELAFSSGSSDFHRPFNGEMRETHTTTMEAALNFSPGLCVYMLDQVSFNISFGVFGLNIKHEKQKENGEYLGSRTTSGANFRFNIFNINFGIAVNI